MEKPKLPSIRELYNDDFRLLPANVGFLVVRPQVRDTHYRIEKLTNNTRVYYPVSFYKIISPSIGLHHEPTK